jgi:hypothetical protein
MMKDFMTRMTTNETFSNALRTVLNVSRRLIIIAAISVIGYLTYAIINESNATAAVQAEVRMNAICPPLLSITRSARDTLIVMKAEPLCNTYVLEHLK